ncbi:hypothetical protein PENPOL_c011G10344 [Penicillium polonicum]|uniref:Uncharacterized protein n=1 Tax=Penicillium polonicum TaxID=60169 RepID=A0A1V6NDT0_PENPO|nr:hypothetical protein PENPOL_c011G10344 [Penicillium polonicum]
MSPGLCIRVASQLSYTTLCAFSPHISLSPPQLSEDESSMLLSYPRPRALSTKQTSRLPSSLTVASFDRSWSMEHTAYLLHFREFQSILIDNIQRAHLRESQLILIGRAHLPASSKTAFSRATFSAPATNPSTHAGPRHHMGGSTT